jgi:hypothetical protein
MPKFPKQPPNRPFDGEKCVRYNYGYIRNKVVFTIIGNDLHIRFLITCRKKNPIDFCVSDFADYTAVEVISRINEFNVTPGVTTTGEWGRHFEDGVIEIWRALDLPLGWIAPITRSVYEIRKS